MITRLILLYGIAANILDAYLTARGVSMYGLHHEGAPLAYYMMQTFGVAKGLLFLKLIGLPPAICAWYWSKHRYSIIFSVALSIGGTIGFASWLINF